MSRTIARDNRQDKILSLIDNLFDVGRALAKELAITKLEHQAGDQAEASTRIAKEIAPAQGDDGLMTLQEAAKFLHVTEQTVHAWRKRGIIEGLQYGEEWRFERDELIRAGRKAQASKKPLRMVS
jgi:excisionase family DNA binding protein